MTVVPIRPISVNLPFPSDRVGIIRPCDIAAEISDDLPPFLRTHEPQPSDCDWSIQDFRNMRDGVVLVGVAFVCCVAGFVCGMLFEAAIR